MTTPARQAEADRVEIVYYWALNQLGNAMAVDALDLWQDVPASEQAANDAGWLVRLLALLFGFRREAQDLAIAYYRLVRALRTGYAPTMGDEEPGEYVSLEKLREDFEQIVEHIDAETGGDVAPNWGEDDEATYDDQPELDLADDDDQIELEFVADIDELIEASDDAAEQEAAEVLDALGIDNMLGQFDALDPEAEGFAEAIVQAHQSAGNRQAAAAMRIMLNAARGLVYDLADTDLRVIGWVRYSKTGTPCGWCAMLISRGIAYKSKRGAEGKTSSASTVKDGSAKEHDLYHDNCRCVAVPIFLQEQYDSPLFDLNRELAALWKELKKQGVTDLLAEFRRLMRLRKKAAKDTTVPVAA